MANISFQTFSTRNFPVEGTFALLEKTGVKEVEGFGPYYDDAAKTKAQLEAHGLSMPTGHFALTMVEGEPERTIDVAKTYGMEAVIVPYIMPEDRPTDLAGWKAFGARLAEAAKPIVAAGFQFGYHNHDFEFVALEDGSYPIEHIANASDDINLELDLAWIVVAGLDPVEWINKYSGRIIAAHVKDRAPDGENADESGWADLGHGRIVWPPIVAALKAANVKRYVMEHDNPNDEVRFITRSFATAQTF